MVALLLSSEGAKTIDLFVITQRIFYSNILVWLAAFHTGLSIPAALAQTVGASDLLHCFVSDLWFLLQRNLKNLCNKPNKTHDVLNGEVKHMLASRFSSCYLLLVPVSTLCCPTHTGRSTHLLQTSGLKQPCNHCFRFWSFNVNKSCCLNILVGKDTIVPGTRHSADWLTWRFWVGSATLHTHKPMFSTG